jgi:hypothetical protein
MGLRPLVCFAKSQYYTTVSKYKYTLDGIKRQTAGGGKRGRFCSQLCRDCDGVRVKFHQWFL